jgi:pyruvate,water dikinase
MAHTVPLAELRGGDSAAFGGKSATLGELLAAGIPVPPGFAVSTSAYRAFVENEGLRATIDAELARVALDDVGTIDQAAAAIGAAIRSCPVADELREEIADRLAELGAPAVAVRSSALGEDSKEATFAGQQETYLWVRGAEAVCAAVRDCWASLYGAPAIAYRARLGGGGLPEMGVAVQAMVDAEVSGVMFTCNPVSGDPSVVAINASWGLGLAVVGGEVTPDDFLVSKITGEVLRRQIAEKTVRYVAGEHGAERTGVPENLRSASCLDDAALAALVEVGCRVDRYFGARQDIEWAFAPGGELHVLQARPVTALLPHEPEPGPGSAIDLVMGAFGVGKGR